MRQKIVELFEYRKLPELLKTGNYGWDSSLVNNLIELQERIYELDLYLESIWKTKASELKPYWKRIENSLTNLGVASSKKSDYLSYIYKYQAHELAMRKGKLPNSFSIEYYYFYKSCDVKLIRRIIYDYIPELKKSFKLSDWRQFDLITEINDDVEDVFEDLDIINGNYFLFDLKQKGKQETIKKFINYLDEMDVQSKDKFKKQGGKKQKELLNWSLKLSSETKKLVRRQTKLVDIAKLELNKAR